MFDLARVTRPMGTTEIQLDDVDPRLVKELQADIEGLTYQFVVTVAPFGSEALQNPPLLPTAVTQTALLEALHRIDELNEEVRQLRLVHLPDLMEQSAAIREGGLNRRGHLKNLLAAIQENAERLSG